MPSLVDAVLLAAASTVGWCETPSGSNDSPAIRSWLAQVGIRKPSPWCAAWTYSMYQAASEGIGCPNPHPKTAGSQRVWELAPLSCRRRVPVRGAVVVFAHVDERGQRDGTGHVAIVESVLDDGRLVSIEGNSNAEGSRNGDRVARHTWNWLAERRGRLELLGFLDLASAPAG